MPETSAFPPHASANTSGTKIVDIIVATSGANAANRGGSLSIKTKKNNDVAFNNGITLSNAGVVTFGDYGAGTLTTDASGVITATSDERMKTNIRPYEAGLKEVIALSKSGAPILYQWNEDSGMETTHSYPGFGAHKVRDVLPDTVFENANGILSLQDRGIIAALVNAVAQLSEQVNGKTIH